MKKDCAVPLSNKIVMDSSNPTCDRTGTFRTKLKQVQKEQVNHINKWPRLSSLLKSFLN